ncbi:hypothetical protein [Alteromonas sp. 14N.309.X.WAT.G.H12]|uniref:hypothetical protein n=1 Tax=Alteromonas sp. 14N.309.X.WAT.G.H12 TaxID=3120824 RepID=UPI002FD5F6FA
MVEQLKALRNSIEIYQRPDFGSLSIHLHNDGGLRPTVYQVILPDGDVVGQPRITLDTIVCENKAHKILKVHGDPDYIRNTLLELAQQASFGTPSETAKNYISLGLLYKKRNAVAS